MDPVLTETERRLLNETQRGFPLEPRPFARLGECYGLDEAGVLESIERLRAAGVVSRLGAVVAPNILGASTLAAMTVPAARLGEVAALVSARSEVNHNYEREHPINLWFVVAAADTAALGRVLRELEAETGLPVLDLPLVTAYHVDLGFDLERGTNGNRAPGATAAQEAGSVDALDRRLLAAIEDGLPLAVRPYAEVASRIGLGEAEVIARLDHLIGRGVVRRFGLVVRHHELGYRANAMAVWDLAEAEVDELGRRLAGYDFVSLCYRRPPRRPLWPYNLFCMVHGRDRETVRGRIAQLNAALDLAARPQALLFSLRRFKQCGARYGVGQVAMERGAA
jgi:DNA-binding Lrp family transcriptional regulator